MPQAPGRRVSDRTGQSLQSALLGAGQSFPLWVSFARVKVHPVIKLKLAAGDSLRILVAAFVVQEAWLPSLGAWRDLVQGGEAGGGGMDSNGDLSLSAPSRLNSPRFSCTWFL